MTNYMTALQSARYRVTGMDCAKCAAKIENAVSQIDGVDQVRVSIASGLMSISATQADQTFPRVERAVVDLGYQIAPTATAEAASDTDDDDEIPDLSGASAKYRRVLWIVVLLNVGYGIIEAGAGFWGSSQALQADALDFVGDGTISFLGLIALGWGLRRRAQTALIQGAFLGLLGLGVLVMTAYRVFVLNEPSSEIMGTFGFGALVINIIAAALLIPFRGGDANARAIWLFSRNDALGNLAVVIAAGLVWWTRTPWPDLAVAVVIAGLFLQSSWSIIHHARADLRESRA